MFRDRYLNSFESKAYGGNVDDYLQKTNAIAGVGSTKVTPVWQGGGTVKLTILDANFDKASDLLIATVQDIIDPTQDATGIGIAPIGHVVTVDTAEEVTVNIVTQLIFESGYDFNAVKNNITKILQDYLYDLRKMWDKETVIVGVAQIDSRILALSGIVDIINTRINGSTANLMLTAYQIPVLGVVSSD